MGSLLVSRLSETTPVLVTRSPLAPGDPIRPESLSAVEIRLGEQVGAYVGSIDAIPDGAVATRAVDAGELLPISALGQSADVSLRTVVIPVDTTVAEVYVHGDSEEWWTPAT